MVPILSSETQNFGGNQSWTSRPGVLISLLLHGFALAFLILHMHVAMPSARRPIVPVEVVQLAEETVSPPAARSIVPLPPRPQAPAQQKQASLAPPKAPPAPTPERPAIPNPPAETPKPEQLPRDELETKLQGLAQLRQPQTDPRLLNGAGAAASNANGTGGGTGPYAAYSVKDYIRAQVERRWNLNTAELGRRDFIIAIHVVLAPDGTLLAADIVDQKRYVADAAYRSIALSARNAVRLSSPFALPSGSGGRMDMVLNLNPRDTLQ
jgi:hypothetical protein